MLEIPRRSAVSEIFKATLSGTSYHATVTVTEITLLSHFDV